jgi:hypothetical protein
MRSETSIAVIHGYPVPCEWYPDGSVIYRCPWYECTFQTSYSCQDEDLECRLQAYTQMHEHLKTHLTAPAG